MPLLEKSHCNFGICESLTDAWPLLVVQIEILLTQGRDGCLLTWTGIARVKQLRTVIEWLVSNLSIQQAQVTHFLWQVVANNTLPLNETHDPGFDCLIALCLQFRILEQCLLHATFASDITYLRSDQSIDHSLATLIDQHHTEKVLTIRCGTGVSEGLGLTR